MKNAKNILMEYARHLEHHEKIKPTNHGYRRRRRHTIQRHRKPIQ
jgi:hypothetical protein